MSKIYLAGILQCFRGAASDYWYYVFMRNVEHTALCWGCWSWGRHGGYRTTCVHWTVSRYLGRCRSSWLLLALFSFLLLRQTVTHLSCAAATKLQTVYTVSASTITNDYTCDVQNKTWIRLSF